MECDPRRAKPLSFENRVLVADRICQTEVPGHRVQQAYPDGRYRWLGSDAGGGSQQFTACITREVRRMRDNGQ